MGYTKQETLELEVAYQGLVEVLRPNTTDEGKARIRQAYEFAFDAHKEMRRKSGEPYIYHPLEVAKICALEIGLGNTSIVCALLHDVVEDTEYTLDDIEKVFGEKEREIIDGLTKISTRNVPDVEDIQSENFKKMLLTISADIRVVLIKLADRLHNMRTLESMRDTKKAKIASETKLIYAPLAHRFGFHAIKTEMEDLSFKHTNPILYSNIEEMLEESKDQRNKKIDKVVYELEQKFTEKEIDCRVVKKVKSISNIWDIMSQGKNFDSIDNINTILVIVNASHELEKQECWRTYSYISDVFRPKFDSIKDWISNSKSNDYAAIHFSVMSADGDWIEVQIRSERMNRIAERGMAAHWRDSESIAEDNYFIRWIDRVKKNINNAKGENASDFIDEMKLDLFSDEIHLYTPKAKRIILTKGATLLDFAFAVHSKLGPRAIGGEVDGELKPLNYILKNGQQVKIIDSYSQKVTEEWLNWVKTAEAKSYIRKTLKDVRRTYQDEGKELLENILKQLKVESTKDNIKIIQSELKVRGEIDLYYYFAIKKFTIKDIKHIFGHSSSGTIARYFSRNKKVKDIDADIPNNLKEYLVANAMQIDGKLKSSSNLSHYTIEIAQCCKPIPGDNITTLVYARNIIEIHRSLCPNTNDFLAKHGNRVIKTVWDSDLDKTFIAEIIIRGVDRKGLLNDISFLISNQQKLNINELSLTINDNLVEGIFKVEVNDIELLSILMVKLKNIEGVTKVFRK